jgi:hypothetical protein
LTKKTADTATIAKLHDLLKLTRDSKSHRCPDGLPQADRLKAANPQLWKALKHHCVFGSWRDAPACEPSAMMKVLMFAHSQGIRSGGKIAQSPEQDPRFMYLSEMNRLCIPVK